jgi:hypothetical protein
MVELRFQGSQARLKRRVWAVWVKFVANKRLAINRHVRNMQRMARLVLVKRRLKEIARRGRAAKAIQKIVRGRIGRVRVQRLREVRRREEVRRWGAESADRKIVERRAWKAWRRAMWIRAVGTRNSRSRDIRTLRRVLAAWRKDTDALLAKRRAELDRRSKAVRRIQAVYRGHATRRAVVDMFKEWRAAITMQRSFRGHSCRTR